MDTRKPGRCKSSVATFLVFGSHLVPRFECLLASFDFVLHADGLFAFANHVVKFSETHVHVVVAVSGGERFEHFFKANAGVIVSVNDSEEALGHALPGERLSGDFASLVLLSTTFVLLVSRVATAVIPTVAISSLRVIPSASTGVSSSGILSESAAAFVITEIILVLREIFFVAVSHAQVGLLFLVLVVFIVVVVSVTTVPGVAVVFVATIITVSSLFGLFILLVLFVLLILDFSFRSGTDSTERSDLAIHGLEELILLEVVVVISVHGVVGLGDFSRLDVSVLVDVKEAEDSLGVDSVDLGSEVSAFVLILVFVVLGVLLLAHELFSSDELGGGDDSGHNGVSFAEHVLSFLCCW